MKKALLSILAVAATCAGVYAVGSIAQSAPLFAEGDFVANLGSNLDFAEGTPVAVGVTTYSGDMTGNGTDQCHLTAVPSWTGVPADEDASAGGVFKYGSSAWLGGVGYFPPVANRLGNADGNALGLVAVWGASAQYTQEVALPSGEYTLVFTLYNAIGASTSYNNFAKNLIGFVEEDGTEHLATALSYETDVWINEVVTFTLEKDTKGYLTFGYKATNVGSASMPHIFLDCVEVHASSDKPADTSALEAAIEEAEDYTLGFFPGEYAPYNNAEALSALAAAKAIIGKVEYNQTVIDNAVASLKDAEWVMNQEELNAVYNGNFALCANDAAVPYWTNVNKGGYGNPRAFVAHAADSTLYQQLAPFQPNDTVHSGLYIRFLENPGWWYTYGASTDVAYTMPLADYTQYVCEFDVAFWGDCASGSALNARVALGETVVGSERNIVADRLDLADENAKPTHVRFTFRTQESDNYKLQIWGGNDKKFAAVISNITIYAAPSVAKLLGEYTMKYSNFTESHCPWLNPEADNEEVTYSNNQGVEIAPFEEENQVVIMGLIPGAPDMTVFGTVDMLEQTITFEPFIMSGEGELSMSEVFCKDVVEYNADSTAFSYVYTEPVVATFDSEFNITIKDWTVLHMKNVDEPMPLAEGDDDFESNSEMIDRYFTATETYLVKGSPVVEPQTITWDQTFEGITANEPIVLTATASSELPVTYTMDASEVATLAADSLTFTAPGTVKVVASQEGNGFFYAATPVEKEITLSTDALDVIESADARAIYFDLNGVQVTKPRSGATYIVVKGGKAYKATLK